MTDQLFYPNQYADSRPIDLSHVLDNVGLRVYRDSPFSITVQVRSRTQAQGRVSTTRITRQQALELAAYLTRKAEELRDETASVPPPAPLPGLNELAQR